MFVNADDGNKLYICADDGVDGEWQPLVGSWEQQNPGGSPNVIIDTDAQGDPIYVGIGTTNPTGRLTVVGEGNTNSTFSLKVTNSATTNIFAVRDDGKVGIGTTAPNEQLELTGNLRLPATTATTGIIFSGTYPFIHSFGSTSNTFLGVQAGNLTMTGLGLNTALGNNALSSNTTGSANTAIGGTALANNTVGIGNLAVGYSAMIKNTSGNQNTALGSNALYENTIGGGNIAIGYSALGRNTTGRQNVGVGYTAGYANSTGSGNVFLGNGAGFSEVGSDKLYICNSETDTTPLIYGDFANNILTINGNVGVGTTAPISGMHLLHPQSTTAGAGTLLVLQGRNSDGTTTEQASIDIYPYDSIQQPYIRLVAFQDHASDNDITGLKFYTHPSSIESGVPQLSMTLSAVGNLGVGTSAPVEMVDVNGGVRVGSTVNTNAGTIRWTGTDFEGRKGSSWVSLTGAGKGFGNWVTVASPNAVQGPAVTDGFFVCSVIMGGSSNLAGYTDASNPPTTIRAQVGFGVGSSGRATFTMPVKKGDYWRTSAACSTSYWIPLN